jgi:hypothetical protein
MSSDPYPPFTRADTKWFNGLLEEIAESPSHVENVGRRRAGLDMEIVFSISPASRFRFTEAVCLELTEKVRERTGALAPVVYEIHNPHPRAQEAIDYAARG